VVYIAAAPLELFSFSAHECELSSMCGGRQRRRRAQVGFCIGFRNLLAGIAAIVGLVILSTGDEAVGRAVVVTALCYMLLVSLAWASRICSDSGDPAEEACSAPSDRACRRWSPHRRGLLTQETEFLRSATSLRCGAVRLQSATVMAHRDREWTLPTQRPPVGAVGQTAEHRIDR
jgi:hypothetical protein